MCLTYKLELRRPRVLPHVARAPARLDLCVLDLTVYFFRLYKYFHEGVTGAIDRGRRGRELSRVKCLKAELKKKGIETRGLLEDADVVDAYLAAEGRLSRYEASFRPREPALGGDAGSALDKCVKSWGQHNREWCWQLLRYK